jgi:predicted kinase
MATAHLIHGYLGAGKTTFARQLEKSGAALRFTPDEWMARLYGVDPSAAHFVEYDRRIMDQIGTLWPKCLELGIDVILDFGFWTRRQRDELRTRIVEQAAEPKLYHLVCSDTEAWRRIEKRNANLDGSLVITPNTFDILRSRFEPLDADETRVTIET